MLQILSTLLTQKLWCEGFDCSIFNWNGFTIILKNSKGRKQSMSQQKRRFEASTWSAVVEQRWAGAVVMASRWWCITVMKELQGGVHYLARTLRTTRTEGTDQWLTEVVAIGENGGNDQKWRSTNPSILYRWTNIKWGYCIIRVWNTLWRSRVGLKLTRMTRTCRLGSGVCAGDEDDEGITKL